MTEMEMFQLFVYGSWTPGHIHFEKIKDLVLESNPAKIIGKAYRLSAGYPVILAAGQEFVFGEVLNLKKNDFLVNLLDEFHGVHPTEPSKSLFHRIEVEAETETHRQSVWTYVVNPLKLPKTAKPIPNSDWRESLKQEPPLTEKLTEKQRTYILRLGQTTGREIVPIDLPLYRELMNLELIVDKGRRLALSKIGNEVFKYLV